MTNYFIDCGDLHCEASANNMDEAVITAFKKFPPKNASLLTRIRKQRGKWHYISTELMLKRAGYKVRSIKPFATAEGDKK